MEDRGLDASRHALHEHHGLRVAGRLVGAQQKQAGWIATAKTLSFKVRHHLKEEETKFFQLAGRLLSATKKKQLAREYTRESCACAGTTLPSTKRWPSRRRAAS